MSTLPPQPAIVTADLFDAHHDQIAVIDLQFRSFGRFASFFGPAATLRCFEDHTPVLAQLETPGQGRVLVVDARGSLRVGVMGDRLAAKAVANGWRGVVINGAIRDSLGIDALELGVRALGTTARRGWLQNPSETAVSVTIGGVSVSAGHWIYADRDSVIVAPAELPLEP
ncbi:ribonuclease E activity regulator RraA [Tropicimonas sp. IMCC34043]|uniref:ribonuclease E activity regulator RraA n=1 Tax=Tropicimonas sp. IMCC34043 TaxID=2248760 RepID=UPI000E237953|nr:ribonuclease E activity regulator RraA [Tropicimonas sp. IMCC34043]